MYRDAIMIITIVISVIIVIIVIIVIVTTTTTISVTYIIKTWLLCFRTRSALRAKL